MRTCCCDLSGTVACLNCSNAPVNSFTPLFFKPVTSTRIVTVSTDDMIDKVDNLKKHLEKLTGVYNVERWGKTLMFKLDEAFNFNVNELNTLVKKYDLIMENIQLQYDKSVILTVK